MYICVSLSLYIYIYICVFLKLSFPRFFFSAVFFFTDTGSFQTGSDLRTVLRNLMAISSGSVPFNI